MVGRSFFSSRISSEVASLAQEKLDTIRRKGLPRKRGQAPTSSQHMQDHDRTSCVPYGSRHARNPAACLAASLLHTFSLSRLSLSCGNYLPTDFRIIAASSPTSGQDFRSSPPGKISLQSLLPPSTLGINKEKNVGCHLHRLQAMSRAITAGPLSKLTRQRPRPCSRLACLRSLAGRFCCLWERNELR